MGDIISLEHVTRTFAVKRQTIKAVDDVSLAITEGEIVCLVGESGCGKTTTGKMMVGALALSGGVIRYAGQDITCMTSAEFKKYRLGVQMIHQDPYASLNPAHTIHAIIAAPLQHHRFSRGGADTRKRVRELLELVDLTPPDLIELPTGCKFHPRCPLADEKCGKQEPELEGVATGHQVACWHWRMARESLQAFEVA